MSEETITLQSTKRCEWAYRASAGPSGGKGPLSRTLATVVPHTLCLPLPTAACYWRCWNEMAEEFGGLQCGASSLKISAGSSRQSIMGFIWILLLWARNLCGPSPCSSLLIYELTQLHHFCHKAWVSGPFASLEQLYPATAMCPGWHALQRRATHRARSDKLKPPLSHSPAPSRKLGSSPSWWSGNF